MINSERNASDDRLYNDYIDELVDKPYSLIVKSFQAQATSSVTVTWAVAMTDILATDIVLAQVVTYATVSYILKTAITAGTGFSVTYNTAPGVGTFDAIVVRNLPALPK
jgi:hypothetical protein